MGAFLDFSRTCSSSMINGAGPTTLASETGGLCVALLFFLPAPHHPGQHASTPRPKKDPQPANFAKTLQQTKHKHRSMTMMTTRNIVAQTCSAGEADTLVSSARRRRLNIMATRVMFASEDKTAIVFLKRTPVYVPTTLKPPQDGL